MFKDARGVEVLVGEREGRDKRAGPEKDDEVLKQALGRREDDEPAVDKAMSARRVGPNVKRRVREHRGVRHGSVGAVCRRPARPDEQTSDLMKDSASLEPATN